MIYVVDRIEGNNLVLEGEHEEFFIVPRGLVPDAKEGDCVEIRVDEAETKYRQNNIRNLMEELFED